MSTKSKKKIFYDCLVYLLYAGALVLLQNEFGGLLSFGLFMGAVYCESPIICGLIYILSSLLTGVDGIICAGIRVAVIVVSLLIHKKLKKKVNRILLVLYILLANIFYICYKV
ncbi:MAG: hypothetical protein RR291_01175, partial [Clostridia bacterium]